MRNTLICAILFCFLPALNGQTTAQLAALHGSPVSVVAAPGSGKALAPFSAVFQYKAGANPYVVTPNSHVLLYLGKTFNNVTQVNATHFLDQIGSQVFMSEGIGGIGVSPQETLEDAPLMAENDSSMEWTGGDGTVTITVYYTVVSLQ
jgi:hypothetical protein